jgi:hypothetical protein
MLTTLQFGEVLFGLLTTDSLSYIYINNHYSNAFLAGRFRITEGLLGAFV